MLPLRAATMRKAGHCSHLVARLHAAEVHGEPMSIWLTDEHSGKTAIIIQLKALQQCFSPLTCTFSPVTWN
eukprot:9560942-Karenia_brevis.AAC.1